MSSGTRGDNEVLLYWTFHRGEVGQVDLDPVLWQL